MMTALLVIIQFLMRSEQLGGAFAHDEVDAVWNGDSKAGYQREDGHRDDAFGGVGGGRCDRCCSGHHEQQVLGVERAQRESDTERFDRA